MRYDTYTETAKQNFEWIVDSVDGNVHTIRLKADPTYILTVNGTVDGSDSGSGITSDGNIVAQKTASHFRFLIYHTNLYNNCTYQLS